MHHLNKILITTAITLSFSFAIGSSALAGKTDNTQVVDGAELGWAIEYIGHKYDAIDDSTEIDYQVWVEGPHAISHVTMDYDCPTTPFEFIKDTPDNSDYILVNEVDPTTGIAGIKFDQEFSTSQVVSVKVRGNAAFIDKLVVMKGGTKAAYEYSSIPKCFDGSDDGGYDEELPAIEPTPEEPVVVEFVPIDPIVKDPAETITGPGKPLKAPKGDQQVLSNTTVKAL